MRMYRAVHPGEILQEVMEGMGTTVTALAAHLEMNRVILSRLLNGKQNVTAAIALKLGQAFPNQDAELWLRLQNQYDLAILRKKRMKAIKPLFGVPAASRVAVGRG